jgi:hypothetical protein
MGYIYPMGIQNDWLNQIVAKNYKNQQTSFYFNQSDIPSSNNSRCLSNSMGSNFPGSKTKHKNKSRFLTPQQRERENTVEC